MKKLLILLSLLLILSSCETYLKILESQENCPECQYALAFYKANEQAIQNHILAQKDTVFVPQEVIVEVPAQCPDCPPVPVPDPCPDCPQCETCPEITPCPEPQPCPECIQKLDHEFYRGLVLYHGFPVSQLSFDYNEKHHGEYQGVSVADSRASFNGSSLITVPNDPNLGLSNAITIMADIFPTAAGQSAVSNIICKASNTSGNHTWALAINSANRLRFRIMRGTNTADFFSTRLLNLNTWYRVIAVWRSGTQARLFIKNQSTGELIEQTNSTSWGGTITQSTFNVSIGGSVHSATNRYFTGQMDNVALWNRQLSREEIIQLLDFGYTWTDWTGNVPPSVSQSLDIRSGQNVTIEAIPNIGWKFSHWSSADNVFYSDQRILEISMPDRDLNLTANYVKN